MSTRYGHTNAGGGSQDQGERKDDGWESRQGGRESNEPGRRGDPQHGDPPGRQESSSSPPAGTNTQGQLAGIGEASRETRDELGAEWRKDDQSAGVRDGSESGVGSRAGAREEAAREGTDQPPRMGGPLGPDPDDPKLPEGAQDGQNRGTGAGGFDRGVDASTVGAVHQGVKEEDAPQEG